MARQFTRAMARINFRVAYAYSRMQGARRPSAEVGWCGGWACAQPCSIPCECRPQQLVELFGVRLALGGLHNFAHKKAQ